MILFFICFDNKSVLSLSSHCWKTQVQAILNINGRVLYVIKYGEYHTHTHTHTQTQTPMHTYICTNTHTHITQIHTNAHIFLQTDTHMQTDTYVYILLHSLKKSWWDEKTNAWLKDDDEIKKYISEKKVRNVVTKISHILSVYITTGSTNRMWSGILFNWFFYKW